MPTLYFDCTVPPHDIYSLEVGKLLYKYNKPQIPATFKYYFMIIAYVCPYNKRRTKSRQSVLLKAGSKSSAEMLYSAMDIW